MEDMFYIIEIIMWLFERSFFDAAKLKAAKKESGPAARVCAFPNTKDGSRDLHLFAVWTSRILHQLDTTTANRLHEPPAKLFKKHFWHLSWSQHRLQS